VKEKPHRGGRFLIRKSHSKNCAQFCAQHQPGLSCTGEQGAAEALVSCYSMPLRASATQSVQVVDSSCSNGYEPEGREFESLRAHHIPNHIQDWRLANPPNCPCFLESPDALNDGEGFLV